MVSEASIERILGNGKIAQIRTALEKDHAMTCLILLYLDKGKWKEAREFVKTNGGSLCDGTFRARMIELEVLGLAKSVQLDPVKKRYVATDLGRRVAQQLLDFFGRITAVAVLSEPEIRPLRAS